ncbi:MAG: hypothetical protein J5656_02965 [Clostridia bacterium]|nr:hypothetical protein [Clostridia bacterium]
MGKDKTKLTPIIDVDKNKELTPAQKLAKQQLKKARQATQKYKQEYFEKYDDVKINHREDW